MKKIRILLLSALCLFTFSTSVFASDWNMDYTYSPKNSRVPIPQCYTVEKVITSFQAENAVFKAPTEIKIDKDNNIFVADTDNNRVVKLLAILFRNLQRRTENLLISRTEYILHQTVICILQTPITAEWFI